MDWLTFAARVIEAVSWPTAALLALFLFRNVIADKLSEVSKVSSGRAAVEFGQAVQQLKSKMGEISESTLSSMVSEKSHKLKELAVFAPNAAVLAGWKMVEDAAKEVIASHGLDLDFDVPTPYRLMERTLRAAELLETKKLKIFQELRRLRNKVAHAHNFEVTPLQAAEYVNLAVSLAGDLETP